MNKFQKLIKAFNFYLNPQKIIRDFKRAINSKKFLRKGFILFEPNYFLAPDFKSTDTAIDVGCGFEVELSCYLIDNFGLKSFCVDPTKKHELKILEKVAKYEGKLEYFQNALCAENCVIEFNETLDNESGSLLNDHVNIVNDRIKTYNVQGISLGTLIQKTGQNEIALLKIDIEGAEYDLFKNADGNELRKCKQIFIEFHHVSVKRYKRKDTLAIVKSIKNFGFDAHSLDGLNYLFVRK
jgi:FkbM family methyltransferase